MLRKKAKTEMLTMEDRGSDSELGRGSHVISKHHGHSRHVGPPLVLPKHAEKLATDCITLDMEYAACLNDILQVLVNCDVRSLSVTPRANAVVFGLTG